MLRVTAALRLLIAILLAQSGDIEPARVVMLGSGTPIPDPASSGPGVAIVVNDHTYLFDAGAGIVRRAQEAAAKHRIRSLQAPYLNRLFLTHLHSDHTLGYPDVMLTPWVVGRSEPLEVWGPKGTAAMTDHIRLAWGEDIKLRMEGAEHRPPLRVNAHEIEGGQVYRDSNIVVRAIPACHGSWPQSFGYAIEAGGRSIVISGDTAPCETITEACQRCDVLVHEVYSAARFALFPAGAKTYHATFHTSTRELAEIASKAKPKLLVLYHQLYFGSRDEVDLEKEVREHYSGAVISGRDLGVY